MYAKTSGESRVRRVQKLNLCYNCLAEGQNKNINSDFAKGVAKSITINNNNNNKESDGRTSGHRSHDIRERSGDEGHVKRVHCTYVLLATVQVKVLDNSEKAQECRALLDRGSQMHLVTVALHD